MNLRNHYQDQGYVIFKRLIPEHKIDGLLVALASFKQRRLPYYSQSIHTWISPKIDTHGFMEESMENFTQLYLDCGLRKLGLNILLGSEIHSGLQTLHPQFKNYVQWQNMLFDKSTGTIDHYDSWYLDTLPEGYLTGAWVALENIKEGAGPFRVYPGSHKSFAQNPLRSLSHDDFRKECLEYSRSHECKSALLEKGDVLFWHPSLIHGAFAQSDISFSRKSLTAHYYPYGFARKDDDIVRHNTFKERLNNILWANTTRFNGQPIFMLESKLSRYRFNRGIKRYFRSLLLRRTPEVKMDMRRSSYTD